MVERKVDWEYLVLAFFATAIIMTGIFYMGTQLNEAKVESLRQDVKQIEVQQRAHSLGLQLAETVEGQKCEALKSWIGSTVPQIRDLRSKVAAYESSSKIETGEYRLLKKRYMNLLVQNMIEIRTMEQKCGEQKVNIIYLYTKKDCERCQDQGTILTHFRRKYEDSIVVHPLDTDLGMKHIEFIRDFYNVNRYPTLIIEGKVYEGFQNRTKLDRVISSEIDNMNLNQTSNQTTAGKR